LHYRATAIAPAQTQPAPGASSEGNVGPGASKTGTKSPGMTTGAGIEGRGLTVATFAAV